MHLYVLLTKQTEMTRSSLKVFLKVNKSDLGFLQPSSTPFPVSWKADFWETKSAIDFSGSGSGYAFQKGFKSL